MNRRLPLPWPWPRSLATVRTGETLRVENILFGTIRRRCERMGLREGGVITCREADGNRICLELENGDGVEVALSTAWFVEVRDLETTGRDSRAPGPRVRGRNVGRHRADAGSVPEGGG